MYQTLPYAYERLDTGNFLVSNMTRDYILLDAKGFSSFFAKDYSDEACRNMLLANRFIVPPGELPEEIVEIYRNTKRGLFGSTHLHIFVLTLSCNLNCLYCQASETSGQRCDMSIETAERAVDVALTSPCSDLYFEFQGGEPLLNFRALSRIVEYTNERKGDKNVSFQLVTNAEAMTSDILNWLADNSVRLCISSDGYKALHDFNRPAKYNRSNYDSVKRWYLEATKKYAECTPPKRVSVLPTITRRTLSDYKGFVDYFIGMDVPSISVRFLSPFGRVNENFDKIAYTPDEYLKFYRDVVDYLILLNLNGVTGIAEYHAQMVLRMIVGKVGVNYVDLRSPCGGAIGQMAYNWDGNIYTCDEGRMLSNSGNDLFKIGNVYSSSYEDCVLSEASKAVCSASCIECHPDCQYCVYSNICGVCPVYSQYTQGNLVGNMFKQDRCKMLKGMYEYVILKLLNGTDDERRVLRNWGLT